MLRQRPPPLSEAPDVRDGLTRTERILLWELEMLQRERGDWNVPTAMLYGRLVEHLDVTVEEFQETLQRLMGKACPKR